jgi:hypothetical protein
MRVAEAGAVEGVGGGGSCAALEFAFDAAVSD